MLKYLLLISMIILGWVITKDISFAEELIKSQEFTKEAPKLTKENSAPHTMVQVIEIDSVNATAEISKKIFIKK